MTPNLVILEQSNEEDFKNNASSNNVMNIKNKEDGGSS
jgi:hypothetical protein